MTAGASWFAEKLRRTKFPAITSTSLRNRTSAKWRSCFACGWINFLKRMRNHILRAVLLALLTLLLPAYAAAQCGVERWTVKTGTDADAMLVNLNSPTSTTIADLSSIAAPGTLPDNNRVQPTETTMWTLNATLTKFVLAYDSDYHMVLTDSAGRTMIAEIPSPNCVGSNSPFAAGILHARAQFDAMFTAT